MTSIFDWSTTAGSNLTVAGVSIAEGWSPSNVNNAMRGMMAEIKKWQQDTGGAIATTGSSNAYLLATNSAHSAYVDGEQWTFIASFNNSSAATLNRDSRGSKKIRKVGREDSIDIALVQEDIRQNGIYTVSYDASADTGTGAFILLNPALGTASTAELAQIGAGVPLCNMPTAFSGDTSATVGTLSVATTGVTSAEYIFSLHQSDPATAVNRMFGVTQGGALHVSDGEVDVTTGSRAGLSVLDDNATHISQSNNPPLFLRRTSGNGGLLMCYRDTVNVGSISVTTVATSFNTSSDGRLKTNPSAIRDAGDIIDRLEPIRFDWDHVKGQKGVGFIAQDLQKVIPEAVTPGDDTGAKYDEDGFVGWCADYGKAIPYIVAELQFLRQRVASLETGVGSLEARR
jgi:hypothetical protein